MPNTQEDFINKFMEENKDKYHSRDHRLAMAYISWRLKQDAVEGAGGNTYVPGEGGGKKKPVVDFTPKNAI